MGMTTCRILALGALVAALAAAPGVAQTKKKTPVKPKTPVKTQTKKPVLTTQGTQQMAGDTVKLGTERTLGKAWPMNIALLKLDYQAGRVVVGEDAYRAGKDQKFLVVHYALHNPQKSEQLVRFDSFRFTAVDDKGTNHDFEQVVGVEATKERLDLSLKPGQKIEAYTFIRVPAQGSIQKLMVISSDDIAMRFVPEKTDIKPLEEAYRDPADATGYTARESVPAKLGETFELPMGESNSGDYFDVQAVKLAKVEGNLGDHEVDEGKQLVTLTLKVTNAGKHDGALFRFDSFGAVVKTEDGEDFGNNNIMIHASESRDVEFHIDKGATVTFRTVFQVPANAKLKTLVLRGPGEDGRAHTIDISGAL